MVAMNMTEAMFIPDTVYWIVAPTYALGEKEFRIVYDNFFRKLSLGSYKGFRKIYNLDQGNMRIQTPWNSILEVKSAEKQDSLVGEGLDGVILSEAAIHKRDTWEMYIEPALLDKRGWADFPSTPRGHNWYEGLWWMGQDPLTPHVESWRFPTWENTAIFPKGLDDPEIQAIKSRVSEFHWRQEYCAEFTAFEGRIYEEFDRVVHVLDIEYNPQWRNFQAFDFGFADPFVCLDIMVDPSDNVYVWREYQVRRRTNSEHAVFLNSRANPPDYHVDGRFGDPRDPDAISTLNAHLTGPPIVAHPLPSERGLGEWIQGIDIIKQWLKVQPDGKPKLFFDRSCTETIRQFEHLRSNEPREGKNVREGQKDFDDHGPDALRYFFSQYFLLGWSYGSLSDVYNKQPNEAESFFLYHSPFRLDKQREVIKIGA